MIRKLRKKFILAAVAAVFLVLLLLIGAINVLNFRSLVRDADSTLEILSQNGGRFPGQMFRPEDQPTEMIPPPQSMQGPPQDPTAPPDREELPDTGRKGPFGDRRGGFGELAYQSRYFTASFDSEGNVTVNLDNLASLTEDEARALAAAVYAQGREKGFADAYRYRRTEAEGAETLLLCQHRDLPPRRSRRLSAPAAVFRADRAADCGEL